MQSDHAKITGIASQDIRNEGGFTIIEMIVSMTIFLMVTGAVWGLLRAGQQSRTVVNHQVELSKTVRMGMQLLKRDTYNAGFGYPLESSVLLPDNRVSARLGVPVDFDPSRDSVPPIIAGNDITLNTFNTAANVRTDQVSFLFKDSTFNLVNINGILISQPLSINAVTTTGTGIDEIVPIVGSNAACRVNDIYLVTGNTGSRIGVATSLFGGNTVRFSNGDPLGFNLTGNVDSLRGITLPASMQRVNLVTYFVTADGVLTRREFANRTPAVAFVDDPLVYNVEDFQVRYVMDNGAVTDNPSAGGDGIPGNGDDDTARLEAVRQVRFTISVRTTELRPDGQPNRFSMTSTFSTRNLGYDAG